MKPHAQRLHLLASLFERAGTVDFLRCMTQFFFHWQLCRNAAPRFVFAEATSRQTLKLLFRTAPSDHQPIEMFVYAGFDEQRSFDKCRVARAFALPFVELPQDNLRDPWMDNGVEPVEFGVIGKDQRAEFASVHTALAIGDRRTEFAEHFFVGGLARLYEFVRKRVGVKDREAQFAEHGRDGAFAAGDPAGQSESEHLYSCHRADAVDCVAETLGEARRRRAAFTVLLMSIVMVIGPTPPGTGVSAPAVFTASG